MGYTFVYRSLTELFPQTDARILKAVAIENPKDADEAASVVLSEIVPSFYPNLADNCTQPLNKTPGKVPDKKDGALTGSETGASSSGTISLALDSDHQTRAPTMELTKTQSKSVVGLSGSDVFRVVSSDLPAFSQAGTKLTSDLWEGSDQAESSTSAYLAEDNLETTQNLSRSVDVREATCGSLAGENSDSELSGSNLVEETSNGSLAIENGGDLELGGAFSSIVSRSTQGCKIDHLEQVIEDAKSNKRTLFTVMESIMSLMRVVELQEKEAEKLMEEATREGFDTLQKVEDLKKILAHAKEGNDMDAGEVYGERSILTTEVNELENRLLNLSEERDKSLSVLDEMRGVLEMRLAAALKIKNAAEQEEQEKEGSARKAFAEQEAIMERVVQESKRLRKEGEENSKLIEFLMDRGRVVDSLQGEISVICQDIRILKEKFDNRVPLSQSISSSQTSCKLAASGSSVKSLLLEKSVELSSYEAPEGSGKDELKELLKDGWECDFFFKETEL